MALPQLRGPALAQDPASDEAVVEEVLDGESARFEVLMRRHNQRLFRTARAILKDDAEAEDAEAEDDEAEAEEEEAAAEEDEVKEEAEEVEEQLEPPKKKKMKLAIDQNQSEKNASVD